MARFESLRDLYKYDPTKKVTEVLKGAAKAEVEVDVTSLLHQLTKGPFHSTAQVPEYERNEIGKPHCGVSSPEHMYVCTRPLWHDGEHEGHVGYGPTIACAPPWTGVGDEAQWKYPLGEKSQATKEYLEQVKHWSTCVPAKYIETFQDGSIGSGHWCGMSHPTKSLYCSLILGHDGPHEAHWSKYVACGPPWEDGKPVTDVGPKFSANYTMGSTSVCNTLGGSPAYWCTREAGHEGPHQAVTPTGTAYNPPWDNEKDVTVQIIEESPIGWKLDNGLAQYPHATAEEECCAAYDPSEVFQCTRPKGHSGVHEATGGTKHLCCPPWPTEVLWTNKDSEEESPF